MRKTINFSAGPANLPEEVLQQAANEMLDWHGSGMSVMEMSHRGREFMSIHAQAQVDLRELMQIPENYKTLFLQGGGTTQFAMVPCNMLRGKKGADYINTGEWSSKAIREAGRFCEVNVAASSQASQFDHIPERASWKLKKSAAYAHICLNETIRGVEYHWIPDVGSVPLVADISSTFLSRPLDVSKFALLYGGAQKNIGPAGLTIAILRDDMLGKAKPTPPTMLDYTVHAQHDSMLNTPPSYAIYIAGLVFQWLKRQGGLTAIAQRNADKAALLYDYLDSTSFYRAPVAKVDRSLMNVPFFLPDDRLNEAFLAGAKERDMIQLKGHKIAGGMRASIYNAMPREGVERLVQYMKDFEATKG
jgi:phosphoserine aminotransferase